MLCYKALFQMFVQHGLLLFHEFQKYWPPLKILLVDLNMLSLVLPFVISVLFGHCLTFLQFSLPGLSFFVQLSRIHTDTVYWLRPQNAMGGDTVGGDQVFWKCTGCLRPTFFKEIEKMYHQYIT